MILELHRQGLKVSAIARQLGIDRKTVRRYIARGLEPPAYGPRLAQQKSTDPFLPYLRERLACGCVASCVSEAMAAVTQP